MTPTPVATARSVGMAAREALRVGVDRLTSVGADIPLRIDDVTERWLEKALGLPDGAITSVRVVSHDSGTAGRAMIEVKSETDLPSTLFVKLPPRNYLQHVLMNVFDLGIRETVAYQALGDDPPVRVPHCYAASSDRLRKRSVLVLEDLSGGAEFRTVVDAVTPTEAAAVIDALADLHARFWGTDRFATDLRPLAYRSPAQIDLADLIRKRFMGKITGHTAPLIPAEVQEDCRIFYERSAEIDAFWAAQPQTLLHGDPHLGNLYFTPEGPGFLDWQIALSGSGARDVAYFLTASVEPDLLRTIERDLVTTYVNRLRNKGIQVDDERTWLLYRAAITEPFLAFVCTAEAGERMQPFEVSRIGVERAVAAVTTHNSFKLLASLI